MQTNQTPTDSDTEETGLAVGSHTDMKQWLRSVQTQTDADRHRQAGRQAGRQRQTDRQTDGQMQSQK